MKKCPVCGKKNTIPLCDQCGFDATMHYESYPTLCLIEAPAISFWKAEWEKRNKQFTRCDACGSTQFHLDLEQMQQICSKCGKTNEITKQGSTKRPESPTPVIHKIPQKPGGMTIAAGMSHTVAVKKNGRVVVAGSRIFPYCRVSRWRDIVAVAAGWFHTVGLKSDGTVIAKGYNDQGQCNVSDWKNIVAIAAGHNQTFGLKADGTVVVTGDNKDGLCNVSDWTDIVAISASFHHTAGLRADGTVVELHVPSRVREVVDRKTTGHSAFELSDYERHCHEWKNIQSIGTSWTCTFGIKADGTVVPNSRLKQEVASWRNIVALTGGLSHTVGLKADRTVVATGSNYFKECNVSHWKNIVAVAACDHHTVGLKADGTVVSTGNRASGRCRMLFWRNIKIPEPLD